MEWERLDIIMGPPRSVAVAQRRPLSTSTLSSSASLPSSLQPMSSKESNHSTSSPSIVPKSALLPPPPSRAVAVPRSTSTSSSLPYRPPALAAHDVPFPRTSSDTRPRSVLSSKPVSALPSPANLDTSSTSQRRTIAQKRFFGTGFTFEQEPQKRQRLASNDDELGSIEKGKGNGKEKEREVSKEVEEGELAVSGKAKDSNGEQITRSSELVAAPLAACLPELTLCIDITQRWVSSTTPLLQPCRHKLPRSIRPIVPPRDKSIYLNLATSFPRRSLCTVIPASLSL